MLIRTLQYAEAQARIRARLGIMPDAATWERLVAVNGLATLLERMRSAGLAYWVGALSRSPHTSEIEDHLYERAVAFVEWLARQLPPKWKPVAAGIRTLPDIAPLGAILRETHPVLPAAARKALVDLADLPLEYRRVALSEFGYGWFASGDEPPLVSWLARLYTATPSTSGREHFLVQRLTRLVEQHASALTQARRKRRQAGSGDSGARNLTLQWRLRNEFAHELRFIVADNPFNACFVLAYGLLEAHQYERVRALLLARARGWRFNESILEAG